MVAPVRDAEVMGNNAPVGSHFQVNTLVSEETLGDLPAVHQLVSALGAQGWSLFFLVGVGRGTVLRPITAEACERLLDQLLDWAGTSGPAITTTEAPHFRRVALDGCPSRGLHSDRRRNQLAVKPAPAPTRDRARRAEPSPAWPAARPSPHDRSPPAPT